jgi:hypothetical protein
MMAEECGTRSSDGDAVAQAPGDESTCHDPVLITALGQARNRDVVLRFEREMIAFIEDAEYELRRMVSVINLLTLSLGNLNWNILPSQLRMNDCCSIASQIYFCCCMKASRRMKPL